MRVKLVILVLTISVTSSRVVETLLLQPGSVCARVLKENEENKVSLIILRCIDEPHFEASTTIRDYVDEPVLFVLSTSVPSLAS